MYYLETASVSAASVSAKGDLVCMLLLEISKCCKYLGMKFTMQFQVYCSCLQAPFPIYAQKKNNCRVNIRLLQIQTLSMTIK